MKTAIEKAIEDIAKDPQEMHSGKTTADWLQAVYLPMEKQQIKDAVKAGNTSFALEADLETMAEQYYNETFASK